jgi:hypothetical protein
VSAPGDVPEGGEAALAELAPVPEAFGPADFVRRILERGDVVRVRGPLRRVKKASLPPRIAFLRDATIKGVLQWLVRQGGWRSRTVVAGKRRREGRLWATGIFEALQLRYTPASMELLARAATWASQGGALTLPPPAETRGLAPETTGDLVLFHLVIDALLDLPAPMERYSPIDVAEVPSVAEKARARPKKAAKEPAVEPKPPQVPAGFTAEIERRRALLAISPLTALARADDPWAEAIGTDAAFASGVLAAKKRLAPLVAGDRAVLLTYLDDALAIRWIEDEKRRRAVSLVEASRRYLALAATLEGLGRAAIEAGRPDALRPVARFFERWVLSYGQREAVLQDFRDRSMGLVKASDRAGFLAEVARLFGAVRPIAGEAERVLATPFVDRTEEDKVFIADIQELMRQVEPELEAIRRELAGVVG